MLHYSLTLQAFPSFAPFSLPCPLPPLQVHQLHALLLLGVVLRQAEESGCAAAPTVLGGAACAHMGSRPRRHRGVQVPAGDQGKRGARARVELQRPLQGGAHQLGPCVIESYPASVVCAGEKGGLQLAAASPARAPEPEPVELAPPSTQPLEFEPA